MFTCGSSKVFRANRKANGVTQGTQGTRSEFTPGVSLGGSGVSIGGVRMLRVGTPVNMFAFGTVLMRLHFLPANGNNYDWQVL